MNDERIAAIRAMIAEAERYCGGLWAPIVEELLYDRECLLAYVAGLKLGGELARREPANAGARLAISEDLALVERIVRLRDIVRRRAALSKKAFAALVALNAELVEAGGTAHARPKVIDGRAYWAVFHGYLQPGEAFSHGGEKDPAEPLNRELGERCAAALDVWRLRAIKMTTARKALETVTLELVG